MIVPSLSESLLLRAATYTKTSSSDWAHTRAAKGVIDLNARILILVISTLEILTSIVARLSAAPINWATGREFYILSHRAYSAQHAFESALSSPKKKPKTVEEAPASNEPGQMLDELGELVWRHRHTIIVTAALAMLLIGSAVYYTSSTTPIKNPVKVVKLDEAIQTERIPPATEPTPAAASTSGTSLPSTPNPPIQSRTPQIPARPTSLRISGANVADETPPVAISNSETPPTSIPKRLGKPAVISLNDQGGGSNPSIYSSALTTTRKIQDVALTGPLIKNGQCYAQCYDSNWTFPSIEKWAAWIELSTPFLYAFTAICVAKLVRCNFNFNVTLPQVNIKVDGVNLAGLGHDTQGFTQGDINQTVHSTAIGETGYDAGAETVEEGTGTKVNNRGRRKHTRRPRHSSKASAFVPLSRYSYRTPRSRDGEAFSGYLSSPGSHSDDKSDRKSQAARNLFGHLGHSDPLVDSDGDTAGHESDTSGSDSDVTPSKSLTIQVTAAETRETIGRVASKKPKSGDGVKGRPPTPPTPPPPPGTGPSQPKNNSAGIPDAPTLVTTASESTVPTAVQSSSKATASDGQSSESTGRPFLGSIQGAATLLKKKRKPGKRLTPQKRDVSDSKTSSSAGGSSSGMSSIAAAAAAAAKKKGKAKPKLPRSPSAPNLTQNRGDMFAEMAKKAKAKRKGYDTLSVTTAGRSGLTPDKRSPPPPKEGTFEAALLKVNIATQGTGDTSGEESAGSDW